MNVPGCLNLFSLVVVSHLAAAMSVANGDSESGQSALLNSISKVADVQVSERSWEFVVIHHSATTSGSVESIHREHRSRRDRSGNPWLGIGYHFVIGNGMGMADGQISPTFRWKQQIHGAHSGSLRHNDRGVGICLIGNFEESSPSPAQLNAVTELIRHIARQYHIQPTAIIGHKNVRATACPGRHFPLADVVEKVKQDIAQARSTPTHSYYPEHTGQY